MKYKKLLSVLLAMVLVLSLAPTAVFAGSLGDGYPGVYQVLGDTTRAMGIKKTWLYADGQEIPADELAALIDQGVIPESVDIFYGLASSDGSQSAYVNADGAIVHGLLEVWDWNNFDTGEYGFLEHVDLTALGPEDIGGWSKQTLSSENDWSIVFTGGWRVVGVYYQEPSGYEFPDCTTWVDGGDRELMGGFSSYARYFNLEYNPFVTYCFLPVKEFIPEGFPLVSASSKLEEMTEIYETGFDSTDILSDMYSGEWLDRYGIEFVNEDNDHDAPYEIGEMLWTASWTIPITNTYSGERPWKDISVSKTWEGGSAASRPQSITVNLLANGEKVASKTVRAADDWTCTFTDMPVYSNGEEIVYTVTEDAVKGYEATSIEETEPGVWSITNEKQSTPFDDPTNPPAPDPDDPRPDLNTKDHYAYIIGYPDGLVRPNGTITRAETVTIFFRMLTDASRDAVWSTTNSFTDVKAADWFNNAISTMENGGIINGYPDGTFNPNGKITRAEFAAMAIRFFQDAKVGPSKFSDTIGHWAEEAINKALEQGLITGYPDGTFRPDQPITRAEAMTIVNRVLKRAPHKDHLLSNMIQWPDNANRTIWYYADVQEATNSHEYTMSGEYENWEKLLPVRDWEAFEKMWSTAHSASNPGEVIGD